ncbi:hypothetical protein [Bacillus subtilis]
MKILLSPQVPVNPIDKITYAFEEDVIRVTMPDGKTDTFDFTGLPDGELELGGVETVLEPNPLLSAKKVEGVLYVELLNYIGLDATEEEKFPEWFEPTKYDVSENVEEPEGWDDF